MLEYLLILEETTMAKYTEARKEGNRNWDKKNLDRLSIALPKGSKDKIAAHAIIHDNGSMNAFIKRAIDETMQRDNEKG